MLNANRMKLNPPPGKKLVRDWKGLVVKSKREFRNGIGVMPAGTVFIVESCASGTGLHLLSEPCPHCGGKYFISRISDRDVEVVDRMIIDLES